MKIYEIKKIKCTRSLALLIAEYEHEYYWTLSDYYFTNWQKINYFFYDILYDMSDKKNITDISDNVKETLAKMKSSKKNKRYVTIEQIKQDLNMIFIQISEDGFEGDCYDNLKYLRDDIDRLIKQGNK